MPSVYGDTVNHFRAKLDYSTSQSNTAVSITAAAYMCSVAWGFDVSYVTSTVTINGSSSSTTTGFYSANGATVEKSMVSKTVSVSRGTSAKTVSLSAVVNNHSGYMNGTSTASATVTIPALSSYSVTYDANGGTGAPSSQTKWYGTTLTLSSTRPTREGYTFLSWNTSASGTGTSYAPGASYTANAALTLYAQWEQDYVAPAVTAASAYRVASSGSTAEYVSGAYAYASFSWAVDTTLTSGNTASSVTLAYRASGASSWTSMTASGTTSGTSGTVYGWFEADEGTSYEVRVSVTDTSGADGSTTTLTRSVGVASVPLSVGSAGRAVGILSTAPEEGLAIGGASVTLHDPEAGTSESWAMADLIALLSPATAFTATVGGGTLTIRRIGHICMLVCTGAFSGSGAWGVCDLADPGDEFLPPSLVRAPMSVQNAAGHCMTLYVDPAPGDYATVSVRARGSSTGWGEWMFCALSYYVE